MKIRNSHCMSRICSPALLALALLSGCNSSDTGVPDTAEPPPFEYDAAFEFRTQMHRLAFALQELDLELRMREMEDDPYTQEEVIRNLRQIERIVSELRDSEISTSHAFLRGEMASFLNTANRARTAAERNPPEYYMAGRVSGGCINCHQLQR
ncbi:MAG: hypothetical protein WEB57_05905 [Pseudohongiellaceae bacterium]